jgi:hypothetical protein
MAAQKLMGADKALLMAAFARMDAVALAVALGTVCAVGLFLMTAVLLVKGAPPGMHVGPNLGVLGVYLPGYSVSWGGSVVGALYAGIVGAVTGFVWAVMWNLTHYLYIILVVVRAHWWRLMAD